MNAATGILSPYTGPAPGTRALPGDLAMWFFILAELSVFALLFLLFTWMRRSDPQLFQAGQALLHPQAGLLNTLALVTASGLVAQGVKANGADRQCQGACWLMAGVAVAMLYVVVKCWEYWQLGSAGYGLHGDRFFMGYFLLTGFHFMHVLLGMVILMFMARKLAAGGYGSANGSGLESGACYWHMVDLLWLVLFPIVYVIR